MCIDMYGRPVLGRWVVGTFAHDAALCVGLSACGCRGVAQEANLVGISSVCELRQSVWRAQINGACQPDRQARVNGTEFQCGPALWRCPDTSVGDAAW